MEEHSYCHGLLDELGSLDRPSEADTKKKVIVNRIGVPVIAFSISCYFVVDPTV